MTATKKIITAVLIAILLALFVLAWALQGDTADLAVADVAGTDPVISEESPETIPTVLIAEPVGWRPGEQPGAAAGLQVNRFAEGLDSPRVLYALPNGDVLVTLHAIAWVQTRRRW